MKFRNQHSAIQQAGNQGKLTFQFESEEWEKIMPQSEVSQSRGVSFYCFFVLFNQLIGWGSPISGRAICFWLLIQLLIVNAEIPSQTHPEQHLIKSLSTQVVAQRSWHIKLPSQRHSVTTYLPWTSRLQTSFTWMENKSLLFLIYIFRSLIARCNF